MACPGQDRVVGGQDRVLGGHAGCPAVQQDVFIRKCVLQYVVHIWSLQPASDRQGGPAGGKRA